MFILSSGLSIAKVVTSRIFKACLVAGFLLLTGCQATPQAEQLRQQKPAQLAAAKTIADVPFSPQQQYYCGPTTLSEVFAFHGRRINAEEIAPKLFIPAKQGSLQLEMVSATRQYDFLPYAKTGSLTELMQLIEDDIPVIVFQNLSIQLLPQWHYAVVIGYDLSKGTITLHTGLTPNHEMSFELFEKTWARGNYWLLAPVPNGKTSSSMEPFTYIQAAYDLLQVGNVKTGLSFLEAATRQWPDQWLAYFLIANHYLQFDSAKAVRWFEQGYHTGQYQQAYLNNFAFALAEQGCPSQARTVITTALERFPHDSTLLETKRKIDNMTGDSLCPGG